jgi:copper homeostasis protein (lipoprotein)
LNHLRALRITSATLVAVLLAPLAAKAGSLSGTATVRERIALPPDAVFEAVLIDIALADAPARELGRARLQPAGQPPFRFTIPFRDSDVRPEGRYSVRATVRGGGRLLFTTDTVTPVLTGGTSQPLILRLVPVGMDRRRTSSFPRGRLPESWRGDRPGAGGALRWPVDLASDGSDPVRETFPNRPAPHALDDIGRWHS